MFYSSIMTAAAEHVETTFVAPAQEVARSLKVSGYATDEYGFAAVFIPAVYRDAASSGYLAGYCVADSLGARASAEARPVIDLATVHADARAAAIAADLFADVAAEHMRRARPAPTAADHKAAVARARAPWMVAGPAADAVRAIRCGQ